jgi:UDP-N-acetylmuramate dehydrogenase
MYLQRTVDLSRWNSFGTPAIAEWATSVSSVAALCEALDRCAKQSLPTIVLGGGTNVVLRDRIHGCVIRASIRGITATEDGKRTYVTVGAGESWHGFVRWSLGRGLAGIENLALIPGTVGAAPIQNIGAYGVELSEVLQCVSAVDRETSDARSFDLAACELAYRDSVFKHALKDRVVITSITVALSRSFRPVLGYPDVTREVAAMGVKPTAATVAEAVIRVRRRKLPDPRVLGNAGSFFKNPVLDPTTLDGVKARLPSIRSRPDPRGARIPAAALIDACGFKGMRRGAVGVWYRQPLVLVNHGGARAHELLAVAAEIRDRVEARFGVVLELEPSVIGDDA